MLKGWETEPIPTSLNQRYRIIRNSYIKTEILQFFYCHKKPDGPDAEMEANYAIWSLRSEVLKSVTKKTSLLDTD